MDDIKKNWILKSCIAFCTIATIVFFHKTGFDFFLGWQYSSLKSYLDVAKNASEMGPLIIGSEGDYKIYSIGHNDPAFPILISVLSFFGMEFHELSDIQFINHILFYFSLLCFSLMFVRKSPWVFGAVQILIVFYFNEVGLKHSSLFSDQHSTVPALAILTFLLVDLFFEKKTNWKYGKLFVLSLLGGIFGMFRNYFTYVFVFLLGLASIDMLKFLPKTICFKINFLLKGKLFKINFLKKKFHGNLNRTYYKKKNFWLPIVFPLLCLWIIFNFSSLVQRGFYSYAWFKNPDLSFSGYQPPYSHGIWHSAYLGLGYLENKWGIEWNDKVGFDHARRYDPTALYPNPKHYTVMRKLYFKYLREEPVEYIKNHIKKAFMVWTSVFNKNLTLIIIFLSVFYYHFSKCQKRAVRFLSIGAVHLIPFFIFFIVPVITHPYFYHFAITNYFSLILIKWTSRQLEINPSETG